MEQLFHNSQLQLQNFELQNFSIEFRIWNLKLDT